MLAAIYRLHLEVIHNTASHPSPELVKLEKGNQLILCRLQIAADKSGDLSQGTRITLFLKEEDRDLADEKQLAALVKQYSEFIQFPIKLWQSSEKTEQVGLLPRPSLP